MLDRRIEFHALFEREGRLYGLKQMRHLPARQLAKALACLPHAGDQFFLRQTPPASPRCECPTGKTSPPALR